MSDEVGVDPGRLSQATAALENLRDVLAANVPTIVNTMNEYWGSGAGSPISLAALTQAQGRSVDDASEMRTRSSLAEAWLAQNVNLTGSGMVTIPWSGPALDSDHAHAEAKALAAAEAGSVKDPRAARSEIQSIRLDIADHVQAHDATWLNMFYTAAAPSVASLAATLNSEDGKDGVVLSTEDEQILHDYAAGLAYADKNSTLSGTTIDAFAKARNLWSVGMLFKFGPPGSAYGTQENATLNEADGTVDTRLNLLASVTQAIEMARTHYGFVIPLTGVNTGAEGASEVTQTLSEFDPSAAMLTLATQNGAAAREVLAGPDGQQIAAGLMDRPTTFYLPYTEDNGKLTGFFPEPPPVQGQYFEGQPTSFAEDMYLTAHPVTISSATIGAFFNAATAAPRGTTSAALDSAGAARNLIVATPPPSEAQLSAPVQQALLHTAQRYLLDLGVSCGNVSMSPTAPATSTVRYLGGVKGNPYSILIAAGEGSALQHFLQQVTSNPTDDGVLMASAKTALGQYYGLKVAGNLPSQLQDSDPARAMAMLIGQIQTQSSAVGIQGAKAVDAQHAEYNTLLSFAESSATSLPVIGGAIGATQTVASLLGISLPRFSTDNASNQEQKAAQDFALLQMSIVVPMTQGLINTGVIPASSLAGQPFFQHGQIVLKTSADYSAFVEWFGLHDNPAGDRSLGNDIGQYQGDMGVQSAATNPETPNPAVPSDVS